MTQEAESEEFAVGGQPVKAGSQFTIKKGLETHSYVSNSRPPCSADDPWRAI